MNYFKLQILFIFLVITTFGASAATYTTLQDGDWSNTTNVWSLNGVTPCGCSPSIPTNGDDIVINHDLTTSLAILVNNGSVFTVNPGATLTGGVQLAFNNAIGIINGNVTINKMEVEIGAEVSFNSSILTVTSQMNIDGTVNVDGGYLLMTGGNVIINQGAVFNTVNAGKVDVQGGNISNYGEFNLCATCCFTTSGNWRNYPTGQVLGSGAATSTGGNMRNQGFWSLTVAWCSSGTAQGMPGFENCVGANIICSIVILSAEFGEIDAEMIGANEATIDWFTVTEKDNEYFNVLKMNEAGDWDVIGRVNGAGTTEERQDYSFVDPSVKAGLSYYTIEQVDFDGESSRSDVVSVMNENANLSAYPNPVSSTGVLSLRFEESNSSTVELINSMGQVVIANAASNGKLDLNLADYSVEPGIYFVSFTNAGSKTLKKVVVQ